MWAKSSEWKKITVSKVCDSPLKWWIIYITLCYIMSHDNLILRQEYFWYVCYDPKRLTHSYLTQTEWDKVLKDTKALLVKSRYFGEVDNILVAPIRVYYEATRKCNLSCKHCFNSSWRESEEQLHSEEVIKVLKGFKEDWVLDIRFTGGEFTQREWWHEILMAAKDLWLAVSLNTNWVYDSDDVIEKLVNLNLNQITVSLDWWKEAHNKIRLSRHRDVFSMTKKSIQILSSLWATVRINTVLNKENIKDVPRILEFAWEYCDEINFFAMRHVGRAISMMKDLSLDRQSFDKISKEIAFAKKQYPKLNTLYGHQVMQSNSIMPKNDFGLKYWAPDGLTRFNIIDNGDLYAGWYTPYINNNSSLFKLGNIKQEHFSLLNIWHNSEKLNWLRQYSGKLKDICNMCDFLKNGECPWGIFEMELQKAFGDIQQNPYCWKNLSFIDDSSLPH